MFHMLIRNSCRWSATRARGGFWLGVVLCGVALGGCGKNGVGPAQPVGNYTLSLTPAALTIGQSARGGTTVTITRTNFSGPVTLSLGNAPAGVTGSF